MTTTARATAAGAVCVASSLVVAVAVALAGHVPAFDIEVGERAGALREGVTGGVLNALSVIGYLPYFALLVAAVAGALLVAGRNWGAAASVVATALVANVAFALLKRVFERPRPEFADHVVGGWSMPSGHATMAFALAASVLLVEPRIRTWWGWSALALYAVGTAASRVVFGVHYLTDVVAGALLGAGCALLVAAAADGVAARRAR